MSEKENKKNAGKMTYSPEETMEAGMYLLELIRAALRGIRAEEKPDSVSWEAVYHLAKTNSVDGLSAFGVETLRDKPLDEIWKEWKAAPLKVTYRVLHFDMERERILAKMRAEGLSYLPLKGVHIVNYYPKAGMRTMADNDILFGFVEADLSGGYRVKGDSEKEQDQTINLASETMKRLMLEDGYTEKLSTVHDSYYKKPFYNYEMHKRLMRFESEFYSYYQNPWKRAVLDPQDSCCFHFSDEDEFIYVIVHAYKHFSGGGCGVRLLSDIHVFLEKKGNAMDWNYVNHELESIGLDGFVKLLTEMAAAVFGEEQRELTEDEKNLIQFMVTAGTYGTVSHRVWNRMSALTKEGQKISFSHRLRYGWERMFPPKEWWKDNFPIAYNRPYLYPFVTLYRIVKGLIIHPRRLWIEWCALWKNRKNI